jgi:hypothetical protein
MDGKDRATAACGAAASSCRSQDFQRPGDELPSRYVALQDRFRVGKTAAQNRTEFV